MKALSHIWIGITVIVLVTLLAIAGCQSAPKVQPATTPIPPTETPTVVAEGEAHCPIIDFEEQPSIKVSDPDLGDMDRAFVVKWTWDCPEPYLKGKWVGIQDLWAVPIGSDNVVWTGMYEGVTDEGGVWKSTAEIKPPLSLSTAKGEAKYKGLQMSLEINIDTYNCKFRIIKLVEK